MPKKIATDLVKIYEKIWVFMTYPVLDLLQLLCYYIK